MAKGRRARVSWPPGLGLDFPLALAASLLLLGLVALFSWRAGPAAADDPWQAPSCDQPCTGLWDAGSFTPSQGAPPNIFAVGDNGGFWRSEDGGQTFTRTDTGFPPGLPFCEHTD